MSFIHNFTRSAFASAIGQAVAILTPLLLTPLFLSRWGPEKYGVWLTLSAAITYLSTLDFGMQSYVVNLLTQMAAKGDRVEYNKILANAITISTSTLIAGISLTALSILWNRSLGGQQLISENWLVLILLTIQILSGIPLGVISGIYRAEGDFARGQSIGVAQRIFSFLAMGWVLWAGGGYTAMALAALAPICLSAIYTILDIRRRYPNVVFSFGRPGWRVVKSWLQPSSLFYAVQVLTGLAVQGAILAVSWQLGPIAVTAYATIRTAANVVKTGTSLIRNSAWPELTRYDARGELPRLRKLHTILSLITVSVATGLANYIVVCGRDLFQWWTRGTIQFDQTLLIYLLGGAIIESIWSTSGAMMLSTNRPSSVACAMAMSLTIGIPLGISLIPTVGISGIALGLLIGDLATSVWIVPLRAARVIGENGTLYLLRILIFTTGITLFERLVTISAAGLLESANWGVRALVLGLVEIIVIAGMVLGSLWTAKSHPQKLYTV